MLPPRQGRGGRGLYSGSPQIQEKQVMRLTEEPEERCRDLKKASLQLLWENRGVINWWNKLILRPCLRKDLEYMNRFIDSTKVYFSADYTLDTQMRWW